MKKKIKNVSCLRKPIRYFGQSISLPVMSTKQVKYKVSQIPVCARKN